MDFGFPYAPLPPKTPAGVGHWPKVTACAAVSTDFSRFGRVEELARRGDRAGRDVGGGFDRAAREQAERPDQARLRLVQRLALR